MLNVKYFKNYLNFFEYILVYITSKIIHCIKCIYRQVVIYCTVLLNNNYNIIVCLNLFLKKYFQTSKTSTKHSFDTFTSPTIFGDSKRVSETFKKKSSFTTILSPKRKDETHEKSLTVDEGSVIKGLCLFLLFRIFQFYSDILPFMVFDYRKSIKRVELLA